MPMVPSKPYHSKNLQFSDSLKEVLHEKANADLQSLTETVLVYENLVQNLNGITKSVAIKHILSSRTMFGIFQNSKQFLFQHSYCACTWRSKVSCLQRSQGAQLHPSNRGGLCAEYTGCTHILKLLAP